MGQVWRYEELVRVYDEKGRYAERLNGSGTLEIHPTPPGATVTVLRYFVWVA